MIAKLTLVYKKEISEAEVPAIKQAVNDRNDQFITKFFAFGRDGAIEVKMEFLQSKEKGEDDV